MRLTRGYMQRVCVNLTSEGLHQRYDGVLKVSTGSYRSLVHRRLRLGTFGPHRCDQGVGTVFR